MQLLEKYKLLIFIVLNALFIILFWTSTAHILTGYYSGRYALFIGIFLVLFYKSNAKQSVGVWYYVWGQELKRKTRLAEYIFLLMGGFLIIVGVKTFFGL